MEKLIKTILKLLKFMIKTLNKVIEKGKKAVELYHNTEPKIQKVSEILLSINEIVEKLEAKKNELEQELNKD